MKFNTIIKNIGKTARKHSPEIMIGLGIAGMCATTVLAVKATPKAMELIEEKQKKEEKKKLAKIEVIKETWRCYLPSAITGVLSISCLVLANKMYLKRHIAVATAYEITRTAFMDYKEKVIETIGEKKEMTIRDKIARDKVYKNPVSTKEVFITSNGETLFYDTMSGRYFKSNIESIRKAVNDLNSRMMNEMYVSLNDFYYEIGLRQTDLGDEMGWNLDDGLLDVEYSTQFADDGSTPCIAISYGISPRYDFAKLM